MIKITHFVNPHVFYFRWIEQTEDPNLNKPLTDMETKIIGSVKNNKSPEIDDTIQIDDVVAVYMPDWNKWVRGQIKSFDKHGKSYVWAIDYGLPVIAKQSHIIKLAPMYAKMNTKCPRVFLGGLTGLVASETSYDFEKNCNLQLEQVNWSAKSLEISKNFIGKAVELNFEVKEELSVVDKQQHLFGNLKAKKVDGSWIDLSDCLSNALMAEKTNDCWRTHVHRLETINQNIWKDIAGVPLELNEIVMPIRSGQVVDEIDHIKPLAPSDSNNPEKQPTSGYNSQSESGQSDGNRSVRNFNRSRNSRDHSQSRFPDPRGHFYAANRNGRGGFNAPIGNRTFHSNHRPYNEQYHHQRIQPDKHFLSCFDTNAEPKKEESSSESEDSNGIKSPKKTADKGAKSNEMIANQKSCAKKETDKNEPKDVTPVDKEKAETKPNDTNVETSSVKNENGEFKRSESH